MANVQDILDAQRTIEGTISSRMLDFEQQMKSAVVTNSEVSLQKLTLDYQSFKQMVLSLFQMLRSQIVNLTLQVENLENFNRRNALLFNGIEETDKESCKELILNTIQTLMNLKDIPASSLAICHRLGTKSSSRNRPILVRFTDCNIRNQIWNEKKRLKSSSIVLSEFLTKSHQAIFAASRKHFGITCCWTRGGIVMVKLPNKVIKRIASSDELNQLMDEFPSASGSESHARGGPAQATTIEPPATRRTTAAKKTSKQK